jgi:hypothetical protein
LQLTKLILRDINTNVASHKVEILELSIYLPQDPEIISFAESIIKEGIKQSVVVIPSLKIFNAIFVFASTAAVLELVEFASERPRISIAVAPALQFAKKAADNIAAIDIYAAGLASLARAFWAPPLEAFGSEAFAALHKSSAPVPSAFFDRVAAPYTREMGSGVKTKIEWPFPLRLRINAPSPPLPRAFSVERSPGAKP